MDKKTYLTQLANHLKELNKEEFDNAMSYVEEYFAEAGVANEQRVIEELGLPLKYAKQIKAEAMIRVNEPQNRQRKAPSGIQSIWYIIAGICALPLAFPLAIVVFVLLLVLVVLLFTFALAGICLLIAGYISSVPLFLSSFSMFSVSTSSGMMAIGVSIAMLGAAIFATCVVVLFFSRFIPWIIQLLSNLFKKLKGGIKNEE